MRPKNIYGLMSIIAVAWLLIMAESYFFIAVIRPLGPPFHGGPFVSTSAKLLLSVGLGVVWVAVMFAMDTLYTRSRLTPTSAS